MTAKKISIDQARRLFEAMGLPVASDGVAGFHLTARGVRGNLVKAATQVEARYQFQGGTPIYGEDLPWTPKVRALYERAVESPPPDGYEITRSVGGAALFIRHAKEESK